MRTKSYFIILIVAFIFFDSVYTIPAKCQQSSQLEVNVEDSISSIPVTNVNVNNLLAKLLDEYDIWKKDSLDESKGKGFLMASNYLKFYKNAGGPSQNYFDSLDSFKIDSLIRITNSRVDPREVAWSAAFVSYVFKQSGHSNFPSSRGHYSYIYKSAHVDSIKQYLELRRYSSYKPKVGDLICYWRRDGPGRPWNYDRVIRNSRRLKDYTAHCDCVYEVNDSVRVIGGNVGSKVKSKSYSINQDGFILIGGKWETRGQSRRIRRRMIGIIENKY